MSKATFSVDQDTLEVTITKVFKASPERLFKAHTDPAEIVKWWGVGTVVDKHDLQVGGAWRFVQTDPDGKTNAFNGIFKEIDPPNKLVRTFEYEPMAGHVMVESFELTPEAGGQTKLTVVSHFDNAEDMNGMVSYGMEQGSSAGLERLAEVVETA